MKYGIHGLDKKIKMLDFSLVTGQNINGNMKKKSYNIRANIYIYMYLKTSNQNLFKNLQNESQMKKKKR